ncbi:MAG: hypothetical protein HKP55_14925 [Gammaproteobacteria bacterium]|nr:hypothetical protein [Gammaproteobacteria bacterium]
MTNKKSFAEKPDLDWSQVRETVRMLSLAVAQIEMAMNQSDDSLGALTTSFTAMVEQTQKISAAAEKISIEGNEQPVADIQGQCTELANSVNHSIVAFQFYDKLTQRLDHVNHSLNALAELVSDQARLYNPNEWMSLQGSIRGRYSMIEEQEMFDALLSGASVEEALEICRAKVNEVANSADQIEFF